MGQYPGKAQLTAHDIFPAGLLYISGKISKYKMISVPTLWGVRMVM